MAFLAGRPTASAPNWNPAPALKSLAGRFVSVSGAESFGPADESGDSLGNVTPCPGRRAAAQRPTRQKAPFPRFCLLINLLIQRVARPRLTWPSAPHPDVTRPPRQAGRHAPTSFTWPTKCLSTPRIQKRRG